MGRRKKGDKISGWINLDKPVGLGSTQAVSMVRRLLNAQKAGHAGTLDPLASGILPIALGEATKTIPYCQDALKSYDFTITWGENRDTLDAEGDITDKSNKRSNKEEIENALPTFVGNIQQIPPKYSAIKINGERAYDLARDGEDFEIKPREVFVKSLEIVEHQTHQTTLTMTCGKGTYVRAIARDLAEMLNTCGYISMLRRTAVGDFTTKNAILLDNTDDLSDSAALNAALLPLETALDDILVFPITQDEATTLRHGQSLALVSKPDYDRVEQAGLQNGSEILTMCNDKPVAICHFQSPNIKPVRVFNLNET